MLESAFLCVCVWLLPLSVTFLRLTHVVLLLCGWSAFCLSVHQLMYTCGIFTLWLLGIMPLPTLVDACVVCSVLFCIHLGVEVLGHLVNLLRNCQTVFHNIMVALFIPISSV